MSSRACPSCLPAGAGNARVTRVAELGRALSAGAGGRKEGWATRTELCPSRGSGCADWIAVVTHDGPSLHGVTSPFRVLSERKVAHYWFCAPSLPLACAGYSPALPGSEVFPFAPSRATCDARRSSPGVPPSSEVSPRAPRRIASRLRPLSWGLRPFSARDFGSPLPPGLPHPVRSASRASHPPGGLLLPKRAGLFHPAGALGVLALQGLLLPRRRAVSSTTPCPPGVPPVHVRLPWSDGDGRPGPARLEFAAGPISPSGPRSPRESDTGGAALAAADGRSPPGLFPP